MNDWRPTATIETLRLRARLLATIRDFFARRDVLEVETPILSQAGNSDPNILGFHARFQGHADAGASDRWLRTSPEYPLKRLLAAGVGDCYELGRVFRNGEAGHRHNPEFTMLEWYRVGWDHRRLMRETVEVALAALELVGRTARVREISYRALFDDVLGIDPLTCDEGVLRAAMDGIAIAPNDLSRDDWLDLLLTHRIQPAMAADELLLVYDYPASQCALARVRADDPPVAERFELYLGSMELANGYHELTDAREQRQRFELDQMRRRHRGESVAPIDERLLTALAHGLPACAGVAMGVDRLLAAMLGIGSLPAVLAFPFARS